MQKKFRFLKLSGKKAILLFALALVILTVTVSTTVAVIATRTKNRPNTFPPAEVEISSWTFNDVINAGDIPVYARASVIAAWVSNDDGEKRTVWSKVPVEGVDYTLTIDTSEWFKASDGFYYRKNMINPAQSVNFASATQKTQKDGYTLRILVNYSAIQTIPVEVIESSWSAVKVADDGTLTKKD